MDYLDSSILWDWCLYGKYSEYMAKAASNQGACTSVFSLLEIHYAMIRKGISRKDASIYVEKIAAGSGIDILEGEVQDILKALAIEPTGLGLYDSIHAVICLRNRYRLASSDKDFSRVNGIDVFRPPE
ncbi:MAG: PIN domain-containing protein [Candidatus Micrarchaeota archaeon]